MLMLTAKFQTKSYLIIKLVLQYGVFDDKTIQQLFFLNSQVIKLISLYLKNLILTTNYTPIWLSKLSNLTFVYLPVRNTISYKLPQVKYLAFNDLRGASVYHIANLFPNVTHIKCHEANSLLKHFSQLVCLECNIIDLKLKLNNLYYLKYNGIDVPIMKNFPNLKKIYISNFYCYCFIKDSTKVMKSFQNINNIKKYMNKIIKDYNFGKKLQYGGGMMTTYDATEYFFF